MDPAHTEVQPTVGLCNGRDTGMPLALVHDYVTQRGGAERVVLALLHAFPGATLHTSLYAPARTFPEFTRHNIATMPINKLVPLRRHHRLALPLLAKAFSSIRIDASVVLCSSSGWAHGVQTSGRKIVYCYTPARWLYQTEQYLRATTGADRPRRLVERAALTRLRRHLLQWDIHAARSADVYVVMSHAVKRRVRAAYGRDALIVPPPVPDLTTVPRDAIPGLESGFLLCVARLLPYKNVDVVVDAMRKLPRERLVVVGTGPLARRIRSLAGSNVDFIPSASECQLAWLYEHCAAVITASYEDFGLVPLEGAFFGKPAVALAWGGFLDTIKNGSTGVLFDSPTTDSLVDGVHEVLRISFDHAQMRSHAQSYSEANFVCRMRGLVGAT